MSDASARGSAETTPELVIRKDRVRVIEQPVILGLDAGSDAAPGGAISLQPVVEDGVVTRLEIRCGCGRALAVECVYDSTEAAS